MRERLWLNGALLHCLVQLLMPMLTEWHARTLHKGKERLTKETRAHDAAALERSLPEQDNEKVLFSVIYLRLHSRFKSPRFSRSLPACLHLRDAARRPRHCVRAQHILPSSAFAAMPSHCLCAFSRAMRDILPLSRELISQNYRWPQPVIIAIMHISVCFHQ